MTQGNGDGGQHVCWFRKVTGRRWECLVGRGDASVDTGM